MEEALVGLPTSQCLPTKVRVVLREGSSYGSRLVGLWVLGFRRLDLICVKTTVTYLTT